MLAEKPVVPSQEAPAVIPPGKESGNLKMSTSEAGRDPSAEPPLSQNPRLMWSHLVPVSATEASHLHRPSKAQECIVFEMLNSLKMGPQIPALTFSLCQILY